MSQNDSLMLNFVNYFLVKICYKYYIFFLNNKFRVKNVILIRASGKRNTVVITKTMCEATTILSFIGELFWSNGS